MTKLKRALKGFTEKEQRLIKLLIQRLIKKDLINLDIKKLSGYQDVFRVRKSKLRIIYQVLSSGKVIILKIDRRSDTTYNF